MFDETHNPIDETPSLLEELDDAQLLAMECAALDDLMREVLTLAVEDVTLEGAAYVSALEDLADDEPRAREAAMALGIASGPSMLLLARWADECREAALRHPELDALADALGTLPLRPLADSLMLLASLDRFPTHTGLPLWPHADAAAVIHGNALAGALTRIRTTLGTASELPAWPEH